MSATATDLQEYLSARIGRPVDLTLTDNVYSMVSFRRADEGPGVVLRLHHMFRDAPTAVLDGVAAYVENPRRRPAAVREYMEARRDAVREPSPRERELRPEGEHHDLAACFAAVNARYFESRVEMAVTWGRRSRKRYPRTVQLGSYCHETGVITISPRLDRKSVPRYFVEFILYHEMLHAVLGVDKGPDGRRRIHTPAFRSLERRFRDYDRARAFERRFFG